jgi:hypothetical protein
MIFTSYNFEREDRKYLKSLPVLPMQSSVWRSFQRPSEVAINWHREENQFQIGSCQGNSLSSVLERCAFVAGKKVQLSRIFAYLATQKIDGLLGSDNGSTVSGGVKLALETGCPLEKLTGYPRAYPGRAERNEILSDANYKAGAEYKAKSAWQVSPDHDELLDFIGGGGAINFGIRYGSSTIPSDRVIRRFVPGRGGHAMCILGYTRDGDLRAMNSHGDGQYLITPGAWKAMLADSWTTAIGLMGSKEPVPVDWYSNSPYFKITEKPAEAEVEAETAIAEADSHEEPTNEADAYEEFDDEEIGS